MLKNGYSMVSNSSGGWYKRGGYYIGLFGHYIKNHVFFNIFFLKKTKINSRGATAIRYWRGQNYPIKTDLTDSRVDRTLLSYLKYRYEK